MCKGPEAGALYLPDVFRGLQGGQYGWSSWVGKDRMSEGNQRGFIDLSIPTTKKCAQNIVGVQKKCVECSRDTLTPKLGDGRENPE